MPGLSDPDLWERYLLGLPDEAWGKFVTEMGPPRKTGPRPDMGSPEGNALLEEETRERMKRGARV